MVKHLLLILIFSAGCSTYLPIKYRVPGPYYLPKNTPLYIKFAPDLILSTSHQKTIFEAIKNQVVNEDWFILTKIPEPDLSPAIVTITEVKWSVKRTYASIDERNGFRYRTVKGKADGAVKFSLEPPQGYLTTFSQDLLVEQSSQISLPQIGGNTWRPVFSTFSGMDEEKLMIKKQNEDLERDSLYALRVDMAKQILSQFSPELKTHEVRIEDGEKDMGPIIELIKNDQYTSALSQLANFPARADVFYNMGAILEAQEKYETACSWYEKAYELDPEERFLEQKMSCDRRRTFYIELLTK